MDNRHYVPEISAIKFAVESYVNVGGNPKKLFTESVEWLYECYQNSSDVTCLEAAKRIVRAYIELGLIYNDSKELLDKILDGLGNSFKEEFPDGFYSQEAIKCKVLQIRELLGYWPGTREKQYNAEWIAKDIYNKVHNREYGCYFYGKRAGEMVFELLILEEDTYLLDLEKKRIYVFERN